MKLIVCRPQNGEREVLETGELEIEKGLIGDNWLSRDGNYETQLTIMNSRIAALLAQAENRRKLAGDQLFVDLNLTDENLPRGTKISIGSAIIEVTPQPHNGCKKFVERFGLDAMKFVNSPIGKQFHLRGIYAKVIQSGTIRQGDWCKKFDSLVILRLYFIIMNSVKTAISVPKDLFELSERLAKKLKVRAAKIFAMGVKKLGEEYDEEDIIARINAVCEDVDTSLDPFWKEMQSRTLPKDKW